MTGGIDEKQSTMNSGILNVTISHSRQLFSEVCTVLVLNILDNRVPAIKNASIKAKVDE
jgi:hypothetical protein